MRAASFLKHLQHSGRHLAASWLLSRSIVVLQGLQLQAAYHVDSLEG